MYLIDYGFAKKYIDSEGKHIPYRKDKPSIVGTARYSSINTTLGYEQSRRDDLESMCLMCVYMMKGTLPWMGIKSFTKQEKIEQIKSNKLSTATKTLMICLPREMVSFLDYCRSMQFDKKPDYTYLRKLINDMESDRELRMDLDYDWI